MCRKVFKGFHGWQGSHFRATSTDRIPSVWFSSCHIQTQALLSLRYQLACESCTTFPFVESLPLLTKALCQCVFSINGSIKEGKEHFIPLVHWKSATCILVV